MLWLSLEINCGHSKFRKFTPSQFMHILQYGHSCKMCPNCFEAWKLTISTKMSVQGVPCSHNKNGYHGKDDCISEEIYLHLFQTWMRMPIVVAIIVVVMVTAVIYFSISSNSSLNGVYDGRVKKWSSGVVQCWADVSVF